MREITEHICTDCKHVITIHEHDCKRCAHKWDSKLVRPVNCPRCKSPYWENERSAQRYDQVYGMAVGSTVIVPWPTGFIGGSKIHPVHRVVRKLNAAGGQFSVTYDTQGAHVYRAADIVVPKA